MATTERLKTRLRHFVTDKTETHFKNHIRGSVLLNSDGAAIRLADELWQFTNKGETGSLERKVGLKLFEKLQERKKGDFPINDIVVEFDKTTTETGGFVVTIVDFYTEQETPIRRELKAVDMAQYAGIKDFGVF